VGFESRYSNILIEIYLLVSLPAECGSVNLILGSIPDLKVIDRAKRELLDTTARSATP
jgi:hypothetical protein